jgi:hypothetical protein
MGNFLLRCCSGSTRSWSTIESEQISCSILLVSVWLRNWWTRIIFIVFLFIGGFIKKFIKFLRRVPPIKWFEGLISA